MINLLGANFAHTTSSHTILTESLFTKLDWRSRNFNTCDNTARNFDLNNILQQTTAAAAAAAANRWDGINSTCQHGTISIAVASLPPTVRGDPTSPSQASIYCTPHNHRVVSYEGNLYAALAFGFRLASAQTLDEVPFFCEGDYNDSYFNVSACCLVRKHAEYENQEQLLFTVTGGPENDDKEKTLTACDKFCDHQQLPTVLSDILKKTTKKSSFKLVCWNYYNRGGGEGGNNIKNLLEEMTLNNVGFFNGMEVYEGPMNIDSICDKTRTYLRNIICTDKLKNGVCAFLIS